MDLSVIIVNWNSTAYLKECLPSVLASASGLSIQIIVVDNASYDGCDQMLAGQFPGVMFVQNTENSGFSRANNLGFRSATGRNILFLNPDTLILANAITDMVAFLDSRPDAGAVSCTLLYGDRTVQLHSAQPYPTIVNQLVDIDFLKRRWPHWSVWGQRAIFQAGKPVEPVQVVPGACLMIKKDVFEEVGMFSDDYFMYAEDIDLCYKVNQTRRKVFLLNSAQIVHYGGASSKKAQASLFSVVLTRESVFKFLAKTRGRSVAITYRVLMACCAVVRMFVVAGAMPWAIWKKNIDSFVGVFNKWKKILRWAIGLEQWARKLR